MLRRHLLGLCVVAAATPSVARAAPFDASFSEQLFQTGFPNTTSMAWAPDGSSRLFVTTKGGEIRIVQNGAVLAQPFATFTPIRTSSECGLESIAFHPSFATNGYVYAFVTVSATEQRIYRLIANGNVGEDQRVIVSGLPTRALNHNGGALGIGPDGKLYWAVGDNGNYLGTDADLTLLNAKVGRANLDGSVPSDNPFVDGAGPNNDYIWARGFRNPFTMTFQPTTERLWLNVVGTVYEQVFTPQAGDHGGYVKYENNQPAGFLPPVIAYRTDQFDQRQITDGGAVRKGGVASYTTPFPHRFRVGTKVTLSGIADASFNVTGFVSAIPTPSSFSLMQPGPDATSGPGSVQGEAFGGCVTGGTFWDSSGAPATHLGDFFWGDYNSGLMMRAHLSGGLAVESVDKWGDGVPSPIDFEVGPDGDLYYLGHQGELFHTRYQFAAQTLVVSKLHVRTFEGGETAVDVRLAVAPKVNRVVQVRRSAGDADVQIAEGDTLTFTPQNWSIPQRVLISAARDLDLVDDEATLEVSSPNLAVQNVRVRVTDQGAELGQGGAGGAAGAGGAGDVAGTTSAGGAESTGGVATMNGGTPATGGTLATGGTTASGGERNAAGEPAVVGAAGAGNPEGNNGGAETQQGGVAGGNDGAANSTSVEGSGCSCQVVGVPGSVSAPVALVIWELVRRARRRRRGK